MNINQPTAVDKVGLIKTLLGQPGKQDGISSGPQILVGANQTTSGEAAQFLMRSASITTLLEALTTQIASREAIIATLPDFLQNAVKTILQQASDASAGIDKGLENLLSAGKKAVSELKQLASFLEAIVANPKQATEIVESMRQFPFAKNLAKLSEQDITFLRQLPPEQLQILAQKLKELAGTMQSTSLAGEADFNTKTENKATVLAMSLPIYLGEESKAYPAYIHIHHQKDEHTGNEDTLYQDTWLRVCLGTEHLGVVSLLFHLQKDTNLGIRAVFTDPVVTEEFSEYIPEIRKSIADSKLTLNDITVHTGTGAI